MNNITFSKKLWWSIAKPSKYDDMMRIGLNKAVKYFIGLIAIMALILSIAGSYIQAVEVQKIEKYLEQNVPNFKIENNAKEKEDANYILSLENNDVTILDNQDFINTFKNIVVVNVSMKEKEAISEYYKLATDNNNCAILLKDKCIMISSKYNPDNDNKEEGITKYTYVDLLNKFIGTQVTEFEKNDLLGIFNNMSFTYYIIAYFVNYFVILLILFALDVLAIGVIALIISKVLKKDISKKEVFSMSIYSLTLPILLYIIYLVVNYFTRFNIGYINIINMIIGLGYVMWYFYKNKEKDVAYK